MKGDSVSQQATDGEAAGSYMDARRRRLAEAALSPLRGLALAAVAVAGGVVLAVTLIGVQLTFLLGVRYAFVAVAEGGRRYTDAVRGLTRSWFAVEIPAHYDPRPAPPVAENDGMYRYGRKLYHSSRIPAHQQLVWWLVGDDATWRDLTWMAADAVVGLPMMLLPAALVVGGLGLAVAGSGLLRPMGIFGIAPVAGGLAMVGAGFVAGPALLRAHTDAARALLGPCRRRRAVTVVRAVLRRIVAVGQLAVCVGLAVAEGASALVLAVTAIPLHITGAGWIWYELVVSLGRGLARLSRRHVREWTSTEIAEPYLPPMRAPARRPDGLYRVGNRLYRNPRRAARRQRHDWIMTDAVTWRELLWLVLDPVLIGLVVLPLSAFCIVGFCALVWPWLWWPIVRPFLAYNPATPWQILTSWWSGGPEILHMAAAGPIAGVLLTGAGLLLAPPVARLYVWWTRLSLAPSGRAKLASRIEELSESRDLSTQVRDAELRRIERDLHDGSQARLLAIGLKLDAVKALVDADPDAARAAVSEVQQDTGTAIRELRALVRGIHPPVLAERGLADAIRALVLDSALAVTVRIEIGRPLEQPIETALYFAVSELLSNVTKHAGAATSKIEMREQGDHVVVTVTDDGRGGADPARGSGLAGIARRIAPFDGTLEISSPDGGPTRAVITIPVAGDAS